jgi:hypothetical protein
MTPIEAHNLVTTICNTAVQRGFFATTGDVVQVHEALGILRPPYVDTKKDSLCIPHSDKGGPADGV